MTFEPTETGTLVRFRAHGQLTWPMRLAQPLLQRTLKRQFTQQCANLKRVLEGAPAPSERPAAKGVSEPLRGFRG
jgi:hypothetical protein